MFVCGIVANRNHMQRTHSNTGSKVEVAIKTPLVSRSDLRVIANLIPILHHVHNMQHQQHCFRHSPLVCQTTAQSHQQVGCHHAQLNLSVFSDKGQGGQCETVYCVGPLCSTICNQVTALSAPASRRQADHVTAAVAAACSSCCTLLQSPLCPPRQCAFWHSALQYLAPMHPEHTSSSS
jgi:hypothetical protein